MSFCGFTGLVGVYKLAHKQSNRQGSCVTKRSLSKRLRATLGPSFGFGDQVADPDGERCGNVGTMIPAYESLTMLEV
jgi:hypothetical protein